ncbi:tyrosine-type recombinase/integrase [Oceanospirillum sanctuarii]|uniref:tyrosine-type recombinase/integrase n=1 Tax=Oceanospirillum sanctuarii TaxID=1434821 RepID=UPI000A3B59B2|nr:site-specific integrase [Oceanospirillum sanctuarii]
MKVSYYSAPSCPVIHSETGVTERDLTEFLIWRKFSLKLDYSTVANDARHLVNWKNYLSEIGVPLYGATSLIVEQFRDFLVEEDLSYQYVNKHLISICTFYWWSQNEGRSDSMIGWKDKASDAEYRIRVSKQKPGSNSVVEYRIPFLLKTIKSHQKPVPTHSDIERAEETILLRYAAQNEELSEAMKLRDHLIFRWLTAVGLRRNELVSLEVVDIPSLDNLDTHMVDVIVSRGTKFAKTRKVMVPRTVIEATHEYIEFERADILEAKKEKFGAPIDIPYLFVNAGNSSKHAKMDARTVYDFLKGLGKNITPHALRRYSLTALATVLYRVERTMAAGSPDKERVIKANLMQIVAVQAGHESPDTTIRYYVDTAQARYMSEEGRENLSLRESELEMELALIRERKIGGITRVLA